MFGCDAYRVRLLAPQTMLVAAPVVACAVGVGSVVVAVVAAGSVDKVEEEVLLLLGEDVVSARPWGWIRRKTVKGLRGGGRGVVYETHGTVPMGARKTRCNGPIPTRAPSRRDMA